MVCNRCIMVVQHELEKLGLKPLHVALGEVTLENDLTESTKSKLQEALTTLGFELIDDKKSRIIEKIKTIIIRLIHDQDI